MHKRIHEEIESQKSRNILLVITGPSGAGKDALIDELIKHRPNTIKIITTTTRQMREHESEGNPYHFISREEFERMIGDLAFYEWVEFRQDLYGTQKKTIDEALATGKDIIWKIEAKGIKNIKHKIKEKIPRSVFVYLSAPSIEDLHARVLKDEGNKVIHRWSEPLARWEMEQFDDCDYLVVNEDEKLGDAVKRVMAIMDAKRSEVIK